MSPKASAGSERDEFCAKYRLLLRVGQGGMAEVFVALARATRARGHVRSAILRGLSGFEKLVVVKRLLPRHRQDEELGAMFLEEARLLARLAHANLVSTYAVDEQDGEVFLVMEYLEGQPLSRLWRTLTSRGEPMATAHAIAIVRDVLNGLHHAHELCDFDGSPLHVVHRDVSPQNVFVTYDGQVKVLDFGIAKTGRSVTKTRPGWLKGKYAYMAPEQFFGAPPDRRVDIFAAGVLLWELVAGRQLFGGGSDAEAVTKLLNAPIPALSTVVHDVDPDLDEILARALCRDPQERFETALAMRTALDRVLARAEAPAESLGALVSRLFADARAETGRRIAEQMALGEDALLSRVGGETATADRDGAPGGTTFDAARPVSLSNHAPAAAPGRSAPRGGSARGSSSPTTREARLPWVGLGLAALGAGALVSAVQATVLASRESTVPPAAASVETTPVRTTSATLPLGPHLLAAEALAAKSDGESVVHAVDGSEASVRVSGRGAQQASERPLAPTRSPASFAGRGGAGVGVASGHPAPREATPSAGTSHLREAPTSSDTAAQVSSTSRESTVEPGAQRASPAGSVVGRRFRTTL